MVTKNQTQVVKKTTSKDGTTIAFEKTGRGPAIVLVNGALGYREFYGGRSLAIQLSNEFTVYDYDRRGRGESADTQPYAVEREIEDIETLIGEAGGSAYLYGISSGAILALRAAAQLGSAKVPKLALYEPPFNSRDDKALQEFAAFTGQMKELLEANRRGDAVAFFLSDAIPPEALESMRRSPEWPRMEAVAHTLAYDNAVLGDGAVPVDTARSASMPTLIMNGSESPAFLHDAAEELFADMPHAQRVILDGQDHNVAPEALAPLLLEFFKK